jgi:hypothetical protein
MDVLQAAQAARRSGKAQNLDLRSIPRYWMQEEHAWTPDVLQLYVIEDDCRCATAGPSTIAKRNTRNASYPWEDSANNLWSLGPWQICL